jgi:hypothetical protein
VDSDSAGQAERGHAPFRLAGELEWCPARGQDLGRTAAEQQTLDDLRAALDQVLAVVEHHQRPARGQDCHSGIELRLARQRPDADAARERRGDQSWVREWRELDPEDAIGEARADVARHLQRQRGLAAATHAGERQQPRLLEPCGHLGALRLPPNERAEA